MADPIHCLVFSKDRAMQLDAFLHSALRRMPLSSVSVLAASSAPRHDESYSRVYERYKPQWWEDDALGFRETVNLWVYQHRNDRILFHTDDEVFYRHVPDDLLDNDEDVITLRQGRNTVYCHTLDREQEIPETFPRWKWRDAECDFAYPLSLNACVYRAEWILPLLDFPFENPTQLEAGLACQHMNFPVEYMAAPELSCTVALPHNRVSVSSGCPAGRNPEWQPDALCEKYLDGWRIDLEDMDFSTVDAAHVEVPLRFKREA
jgi:hypothetical protein